MFCADCANVKMKFMKVLDKKKKQNNLVSINVKKQQKVTAGKILKERLYLNKL